MSCACLNKKLKFVHSDNNFLIRKINHCGRYFNIKVGIDYYVKMYKLFMELFK